MYNENFSSIKKINNYSTMLNEFKGSLQDKIKGRATKELYIKRNPNLQEKGIFHSKNYSTINMFKASTSQNKKLLTEIYKEEATSPNHLNIKDYNRFHTNANQSSNNNSFNTPANSKLNLQIDFARNKSNSNLFLKEGKIRTAFIFFYF